MLSPALITPLPVYAFPNILAANVPNNVGRSRPFSFVSFLVFSLIYFISNPDFSSDLAIFIILSISLLEIINVVIPDL